MGSSEVLRDLDTRLQFVDHAARSQCFTELHAMVSKRTLTGPELKAVCRMIVRTLFRYTDAKSHAMSAGLLRTMLAQYPALRDPLVKALWESLQFLRGITFTNTLGGPALEAFSWSLLALPQKEGDQEPSNLLVPLHCLLLTTISATGNARLQRRAYKRLSVIAQRPFLIEHYLKALSGMDPAPEGLVLWSLVVKLLVDSKQTSLLASAKPALLEHFTKVALSSKIPLPSMILANVAPLVRTFSHEDFRQTLMPLVQKALLRNPEVVLETVGFLIAHVSLDLSQYAPELGHLLKSHVSSKEEKCQGEAMTALHNLARQCSNGEAIQELLTLLFEVLNGTYGKLTVASQRLGVVVCVGHLADSIVVGAHSLDKLASSACQGLVALLKQEVHEGILVTTLRQLSLWCAKFAAGLPPFVVDWFKVGLTLKTSTSSVRAAYLQCVYASLLRNTDSTALQDLLPFLVKTVDSSLGSYLNANLITEALYAACCLVRLDATPDSVLKKVCDLGKSPVFSDKFLSTATDEALRYLLFLVEKLVFDHFDSLNPNPQPVVKTLLELDLHSSHEVRKQAHALTTKVCHAFRPNDFLLPMLHELLPLLNVGQDAQASKITPQALQSCLLVLCASFNSSEAADTEKIALEAFLIAHHPHLESWEVSSTLWSRIVKQLGLKEEEFLNAHQQEFQDLMTEFEGSMDAARINGLRTLVKTCPSVFIPAFMDHVLDQLEDPSFLEVTNLDYNIFRTPEGELHDRAVVESYKEADQHKNMKRESKLYSYKEQLEELELKKELEAKRKAKNPSLPQELSKKQQEIKAAQLERESLIRAKVLKLQAKLAKHLSLLEALLGDNLREDKGILRVKFLYLSRTIRELTTLFASPLCAPPVIQTFSKLSTLVVGNKVMGSKLANLTVQVLGACTEPDPSWVFPDAIKSSMDLLRHFDMDFITPLFTNSFPLLKWLLLKSTADDATKIHCLKLMHSASSLNRYEQSEDPLVDIELLPLSNMIEVLIKVIDTAPTNVKELAKEVLLQVVSISNRGDNCYISFDEIRILLESLKSANYEVRCTGLESLILLTNVLPSFYETEEIVIMKRLWIARFDVDESNVALAEQLWKESSLAINEELCDAILEDISNSLECLRISASSALAEAMAHFPDQLHPVVVKLMIIYRENRNAAPIMLDPFNRIISEPPPDKWEPRCGVALTLIKIAPLLTNNIVSELMTFFIADGLGDSNEVVRKQVLDSAVKIVDTHAKANINILLPMFEDFLSETPETIAYDDVRQGVVILLGTLAHHLDKSDPKIKPIISKLVQTLSTPSQQVQEAVANCLPPLVPAIKDDAPAHVKKLLTVLLESQKYGEKRGAAYGLSGLVKGLGILSLKQLNIIDILVEAIQNKKEPKRREGALLAFEMLCNMLGRLFEPYIVHVLPNLLICFGDNDKDVRRATDDTAKAVMSKLSAHGVKLVLPSLLAALEEESWRTKASSVELLGAMAFCAPKQLSSCLPNIVPKLIEVLSDSHIKVQKAGAQALKLIGSVIRNPEIQAIVPVLLEALQDPAKKTSACLTNLLNTKFVHFIDAPSLALIMPVVHRAFQDRSTETRKMAAQIIGNMYSLTDQKDLAPYLPTILPGLKQSLLDPVPEVRSVSARALGTMVRGMGESTFEDLLPWLKQTLTSEASTVDRSGAAQGLSEVLGGLGMAKLNSLMPEIISRAEKSDLPPHVKDGYIMMFIYLPMVFTKDFTPFIGPITKPILKALADENEYVRDTALKAGQRIVNMYAETSIELFLPELERGLFDDNWRIRYSSIQLLGDLLYKISGVTGKMSTESADDDDNFGTEQSQKAILKALGSERQHRVLAGLYMGRSDVGLMVRQAALHVWKVVVSNTPRTLREILPTLFSLLLGCLASNSYDKRQIAAKTLGDLVRKLGERVLPEIIPILEKGLDSSQPDQRQGVCIGLSEIMSSTSKEMVLTFFDSLVPTVRRALSDELPEVRKAAAKTFDSLHSTVGVRALDEILPPLLEQLNDGQRSENTLDGLKQVMAIKSKVVLPYLVPQLTSSPVNTKALAMLSTVAGDALTKHLNKILPALLTALGTALETPPGSQEYIHELEYCQAVVLSVSGEQGVRTIVDFLLESTRHESLAVKKAAVALLSAFCSQSKADLSSYVPQLLRGLIHLYTYTDPGILNNSWEALNAITKTLDTQAQLQHVPDVRQAVRFAVSDLKGQELLPGFCLPKGIMPILPIFREAILNGSPEAKEQASQGLGEVIRLTSSEALKPSVVNITGPLIRILGDRFAWNVKVAVLETLAQLLHKVGAHLKPFLPQLQATFLKALSDANRTVRLRAASALSHLISIHSKSESLFTELHTAIKASEDAQIKETNIFALRCVIREAGDKMSESTRGSVVVSLTSLLASSDDNLRSVAASCLGTLAHCLPPDELVTLAQEFMLEDDPSSCPDWLLRHGKSIALMVALKEVPGALLATPDTQERVVKSLQAYLAADRLPITLSGVRAAAYFFLHCINCGSPTLPPALLQVYCKSMNHTCNEVKQVVAQGVNFIARAARSPLPPAFLKAVIPQLVNGTKEKNSVVKANSEGALVGVLELRSGDDNQQQACLALLDPGARDALSDVLQRVLRKAASQPIPKEEDFDCTLLT